jgi:hypothetical protein
MTSIDDFKHDTKGVSDTVLGDLDTEERLRLFIQEAAEDREERLEWLTETAPTKQYEATDLAYTDGIKRYSFLSLAARYELQTLYQAITEREADRDRYMAVMLLNESLERLSQGHFTVDEYGNAEIPASWPNNYGPKYAPRQSTLATKFRELWEDVPAELLLEEGDRSGTTEVFTGLAGLALTVYAQDYSGFDDLEIDRIPSRLAKAEMSLTKTLVEFYTHFHGWRIFAEKYLDVTLADEEHDTPTGAPESDAVGELEHVDFPAGRDREECSAAVYAARDYLREHGPATKRDLVAEVLPEHPLGYDVDGALEKVEAGDRYRGAWWRRVVKPGLKALPDVEAPARGASEWRYTGEA